LDRRYNKEYLKMENSWVTEMKIDYQLMIGMEATYISKKIIKNIN